MFPSTLVLLIVVLAFMAGALVFFIWAARAGQLGDLDRQAMLPLDERDLRVSHPWETAEQAEARREAWGEPLPPEPGEWGGAE